MIAGSEWADPPLWIITTLLFSRSLIIFLTVERYLTTSAGLEKYKKREGKKRKIQKEKKQRGEKKQKKKSKRKRVKNRKKKRKKQEEK